MQNSQLISRGANGKLHHRNQEIGSGGGSGGTIKLIAEKYKGDGTLDVSGGAGSVRGGGGSGGFLSVQPIFPTSDPTTFNQWTGIVNIQGGGQSSNSSTSGGEGLVTRNLCGEGKSGPFCQKCPVGTFKPDFGDMAC